MMVRKVMLNTTPPQSPHIEYDDKYNLGLVEGHYFINDYTDWTSYCLENYEDAKCIKDCNKMFRRTMNIRRVMIY